MRCCRGSGVVAEGRASTTWRRDTSPNHGSDAVSTQTQTPQTPQVALQ